MARCTISFRGWLPTSRAASIAALTFFLAFDFGLFVLLVPAIAAGEADIGSIQMQSFVMAAAQIVVAPVLLPVVFLMRRDARSTACHAITAIGVGALITAGIVIMTSEERVRSYFSTFEAYERQYQHNLANDRAGRVTYPGTAVREARSPSTIEQRRAEYERFRARMAQQDVTPRSASWQQRASQFRAVALAVLFGVMGWTLAGLGPASFRRAAMWWALMYVAMLAFRGTPTILALPSIVRLPHAMALAFFGTITLALVAASWRRHPGTPGTQST